MESKLNQIDKYINKLRSLAVKGTQKENYNLVFSSVSALSQIQYAINQEYRDNIAEDTLKTISSKIIHVPKVYENHCETILFYDGFGLDLRGWAASFVKGIVDAGYHLIYVTVKKAEGIIPHIVQEVNKGNGHIVYISKQSYLEYAQTLNNLFAKYQPGTAFFYTTPNDVAATAVFNAYEGRVKRVQIDLTDHAFWLGTKAFDYIIESRKLGASNALYHRGILANQIKKMDCSLYINRDVDSTPLPFDITKERYIFSGGSLYKTLGDNGLLFYRMVDHLLNQHEDIKFLFVGAGDHTEMQKIIDKYPKRAFLIAERSDFYRLFEHCIFFLNTYPMFGGLMMRYAANAGKVPLTLKHGSDHEGILFKQEEREIEFDTYETAIAEADRLIDDATYRQVKENGLIGSVVSAKDFSETLRNLIENGETGDSFGQVEEIDTTEFRREYMERLDVDALVAKVIPTRRNLSLFSSFPNLFFKWIFRRLKHD